MEYKAVPSAVKTIEGRTVVGVFAVHGNRDCYDDISHPGSFSKTLSERGGRIKFLWNHDFYGGPPIAKVQGIREISRDELPEQVLSLAPNATGGVEVTREYLKNPRAEEVFESVATGASDEMSYGYDPIQVSFTETDGVRIRNLHEVRLWEVSDVIFGANPATAGSKGLIPDLDILLRYVEIHAKAGARHSAGDIKALNAIHNAVLELGATSCLGVLADEDEPKSRAEPVSLTLLAERLRLLDLV